MKTTDFLHLDTKTTNTLANELQSLLADFQVYYTNLRGFHWNIKGRGFFQLHEGFEKMYNDAAAKIDEVAERILTLNGTPAHNFTDYLKTASIKETGVVSNGDEAVKNILESLKTLIGKERKVLETASEGGDETTVALMSDFIAEQEKSVWMLTAYLS